MPERKKKTTIGVPQNLLQKFICQKRAKKKWKHSAIRRKKKTKVHWLTIAKQSRSFKNLHKFRKKWDSVQDQVPNFHLLSLLKLLKLVEIQSIFKWVTFQLSNFDYFSLNQQKSDFYSKFDTCRETHLRVRLFTLRKLSNFTWECDLPQTKPQQQTTRKKTHTKTILEER